MRTMKYITCLFFHNALLRKKIMSIREKVTDFIGKWIMVMLGTIATVCAFVNMFRVVVNIPVIVVFTIVVSFAFMMITKLKHRNLIMLVIGIAMLIFIIACRNLLKAGVFDIANRIIDAYNSYSGSGQSGIFQVDYAKTHLVSGAKGLNTLFICVIIVEYVYILITATWYRFFALIHMIISMGIIFTGLLLGVVPNTFCVVMLIIYYLLCLVFQRNKHIYLRRMCIISGFAGVVAVIILLLSPPYDYKENRYDKLRDTIDEMAQKFHLDSLSKEKEDGKSSVAVGGINGGELGRVDEIKNIGKTMLYVDMPATENNIYLKGFVGNEYSGNRWREMSDRHASIMNTYKKNTVRRVNSLITDFNYIQNVYSEKETQYIMVMYEDASKKYMYFPYYSNLYMEDNYYELRPKEVEDKSISYGCYDVSIDEALNMIKSGEESLEESAVMFEISHDISEEVYELLNREFADAPMYDGTKESIVECISYVRNYLDKNTSYTLSPGTLDAGKDYVVDFLTVKKKGYCTAYASSAVMMFRYMGIPARYVEGYVVTPEDQANGNAEDNGDISVKVTDRSAHAWPEIYVQGLGFVPVEVTPGYNSNNDVIEAGNNTNDESKKNNETSDTDEPEETTDTDESTSKIENSTDKQNSDNNGRIETDKKKDRTNDKHIFMVFGMILAVSVTIFVSVRLYRIHQNKKSIRALNYITSDIRHNIAVLSLIFKKSMERAGIDYSKNRSCKAIVSDINEYINTLATLQTENRKFIIPDKNITEQIIDILFKAKYSDENVQFSKEEYDKLRQYVEEFKNSLQYFKNKV